MNLDAAPQTSRSAVVGLETQSKKSKRSRGGRGPGTGRKPNTAKRLVRVGFLAMLNQAGVMHFSLLTTEWELRNYA